MKLYAFLFAMALFSSLALAQSVDKLIIVSDITSADFVIAKAAGEKAGIPVLVATNGEITDELKAQLAELKAKSIILVGGPAVIRNEAEAQLSALGYLTVRLWGLERTGTAVEAAKFFWREGAGCSVLVEDTRSSDADTALQESASNIAANDNCLLIPVPKDTLPADVLATLQELGVKEVRFVGRELKAEIREKLRQFRVKENTGSKDGIEQELENEILNRTPREKRKLVIVAAPHWQHLLGTGGHPSENSVVRIASSADQTPALIDLIKTKNITDVRVVGFPALVQQIAEQLNASGITVKQVSGEKAGEVAHKVLKEFAGRWREKKIGEDSRESANRAKIQERLLDALNATEAHLDAQWVLLDKLAAEGGDTNRISMLKESISVAQSRIGEIRNKVLAGDFDGAVRLRLELVNDFEKSKFRFRLEIKLRVSDEVGEEEDDIEEFETKIDVRDVETKFADLRRRCVNITSVETLVEKSKSLRDAVREAKDEGNHTKAAELAKEAHAVTEQARALGDVCARRGEIPEKLRKIAEERAERAEKLREKTEKLMEERMEKLAESFKVGLEELPSSATAGESFRVSWKVESSSPVQITHTAVHYDYASHPGELGLDAGPAASGYPFLTSEFAKGTFTIPDAFKAAITPEKAGTLYLRAHAIINGKNYWTDEKKVEVKAAAMEATERTASYTVEANDNGASPSTIEVPKGTKVSVTFKVLTEGTYAGGINFRSSKISTGRIRPGGQKTVEFAADESFTFNAFWPDANVQKPAKVNVVVK